jgi:Fic family protein
MDMMKKVKFDRKVPYNDLPDLPMQNDFIDKEVLMKWGLASRSLAELNRNILRIPNPKMLVNTVSLQEAKSSTEIENIFTTEDELYKAISETIKEEYANSSTKEVLKYREALWEGFYLVKKKNEIDKKTIVNVFQKIKDTTQEFRSPQSQIVIKRGQSELRPGEIIYTPPRGEGIIEAKIDNLLVFMKQEDEIDPLIKMAIAHYQFEAIHPFTDGNGRTGRILNLLYLIDQKLLSHPVLYLSNYIIQNKDDYYYYLSGVTQKSDWKSWVIFMLTAVEKTSNHTNQLIDEIMIQLVETYNYAKSKLKWYSLEVNQALFFQPYIKQRFIGEITGAKSRTTLTKYMHQLVQIGVLSERKEGKEVFYVNNDLLRILQKR